MKKFLFSLLTLAAALTVASCQKELQAGPNGEGPAVNASFAVSLGDAMTKAFADGTTVDKVYAALYEVGSDGAYTFIAEADPAEIKDLKATVQINGKLKKGKSYRVAFWAQKAAATSPYSVAWNPAPVVTVTPTGAANDEARDAFYGVYDTGEVKGNITAEKVIPLVRPFAQVNVLVPVGNLSADAAITSSMTIKQAPTTLNLNTGETGTPADYVFATASMAEPAFGTYAQTHKYVAMNYVLVDQATANHFHNVEFTVAEGTDTPVERKLQNIPLKANVRTNIVGNIFESFGFNGTVIVTPEGSEVEATDIRIAVGTAGTSAEDPIDVIANGTLVTFAISRPVDREETPDITYKKGGVVSATWDSASKGINIVPAQGVENGSDVVTVTFPEVTKTTYAEGKVDVYVKVGNGEDPVVDPTITVSDAPAEAVSEAFDLTVTTNSSGAVTATLATAEGAATSAATIEKKSGPTESEGNYVWVFTVTPANDLSEDASVVATFTVAEVANAFNEGSETATFTVAKAVGGGDQPGTGSGTLADPYTIAGVKAYIDGLEGATSGDVYVKGKISKIQSAYSESYGTAIFFISDDGTETDNDFEAYSVYFLENESWVEGNTQIQVKDEVILCGKVKKYNSTYETDSKKAYVYSLNNVTTEFVPIKVSASDVTNVPAAGVADQTLTVALKKSTGWTGSVTPDGTVVTAASYADGVITYTVAENKGSARDGSIMLTFKMDGKEDVVKTITVSQLGANDAPVEDPYEMGEGVSWTLGTNCYEEKVKVNGASTEYTSIRAGKSSAAGTITLKIPKGTTKLVFYAISWNGKEATMTIKNGDESLFNQKVRAESGLANSSPYSITVSETDCYTIDFGSALTAETSLTVTTTGSNYRVALFGIKAK